MHFLFSQKSANIFKIIIGTLNLSYEAGEIERIY